jgi:hypothetical protein
MRICRINRGSLKVFLCRDMHGAAVLPSVSSAIEKDIGLSRGDIDQTLAKSARRRIRVQPDVTEPTKDRQQLCQSEKPSQQASGKPIISNSTVSKLEVTQPLSAN